jgi:hypothetical protein
MGGYGAGARRARPVRARLERHDGANDQVVDRVLSRGDGNLANVIWGGGVRRLVDFEDFGVSDLTCEFADLVEHASSRLRRLLTDFWLTMLLPGDRRFGRNPSGSVEDQARHVLPTRV